MGSGEPTEPEPLSVEDVSGGVHLLPCTINYDGPSDVSHYFKPKPSGAEVEGLKVEEAYFRGRKLEGATVHLPSGYSGFVIAKKSSGDTCTLEVPCKEEDSKQNFPD
ncbi:hypothetical protein MLD38_038577 [Melastoma candidum]|uniref:Uncharacterized protein n=1 Tax=Melastoma candidum TaxID=119954 RepID=A0ACB9L0L6_9MYRT|nr:hypothetical protein MLD38_038577 [Melastoma candidum]